MIFVGTQYYRQPNLPLQDWECSRTPIGVMNLAGYHRGLTGVCHQVDILHAANVADKGSSEFALAEPYEIPGMEGGK